MITRNYDGSFSYSCPITWENCYNKALSNRVTQWISYLEPGSQVSYAEFAKIIEGLNQSPQALEDCRIFRIVHTNLGATHEDYQALMAFNQLAHDYR